MPTLVYPSHCFYSLHEPWTNTPAKAKSCNWSTQPSWLLRGMQGSHWPNTSAMTPKERPAAPSLLWSSRRTTQSWWTTKVSVVEALPCSSTHSFFRRRKTQILKKGPRLRLILLCQWQPTVWQNTGVRCSAQLSCFDCICHTLVDLQVEGDDELLVFLSRSFAPSASAGMNLSTQMQNEWMAFNHFDNVNVIALTE